MGCGFSRPSSDMLIIDEQKYARNVFRPHGRQNNEGAKKQKKYVRREQVRVSEDVDKGWEMLKRDVFER